MQILTDRGDMFSNHEIIILMTVHLGDISEKITFDKKYFGYEAENFIPGICYVIAVTIDHQQSFSTLLVTSNPLLLLAG